MTKALIGDILALTCIIFAPIVIALNLIIALTTGPYILLKLGSVAVFLVIAFLISAIIVIMKTDRVKFIIKKKNIFIVASFIYSVVSVLVNLIAWIIKSEESGAIWNLYTIITLVCFSLIISAVFTYLKTKNVIVHAILYFLSTSIPFILITVVISDIFTGAKIFIPLSIYFAIYAITVTVLLIRNSKKAQKELDEKPYESIL